MKKIFPLVLLLSFCSIFSQNAMGSSDYSIKDKRYLIEDVSVTMHQFKINFRIISNEIRAYAILMEQKQHDANKSLYDDFKSSEHFRTSDSLIAQNIEHIRSKQPLIKSAIHNYTEFSQKIFVELEKIKETAELSLKKIQRSQDEELSYMLIPIKKFIQDLDAFLTPNNPIMSLKKFMSDINQHIDHQSKMADISNRLTALISEVENFSNDVIGSISQHKLQIQKTLEYTNIRNDDRDEFKIRALIQTINQILKTDEQQQVNPVRDDAKVTTSLLDEIITHFDLSPYSKQAMSNIQNADLSLFLNPKLKKAYKSLKIIGIIEDGLSALQRDTIVTKGEVISKKSKKGEINLINPLILHIKSGSISLQNQNRAFLQTIQELKNTFDKTKRDILSLSRELYIPNTKYPPTTKIQLLTPEDARTIDTKILKYIDTYTSNQRLNEYYSAYTFSSDFHQDNIDFINSSIMTNPVNRKYMNMVLYMTDMKFFIENIKNYVENTLVNQFRKITKSYQRLIKIVQYFQNNSSIFAREWKEINIEDASNFFESIQDIEKISEVLEKRKRTNKELKDNADSDEDEYNFSRIIQSINDDDFEDLDINEIDKLTDQELILRIKSLDIGNTILADIESTEKEKDSLNKFLAEKERLKPKYDNQYGESNIKTKSFIKYSQNLQNELLALIQFKKNIKKYYSQILKDQTEIETTDSKDIGKEKIKQFRTDLKKLMQYIQLDHKKKQVKKGFEKLTNFVAHTLGKEEAFELQHSYKADFVNIIVQGLNSFLTAAQKK
ncbi:MAG: hypothetical protein C0432_00365 [Candidatus Puniceispirillum sp.]|nr:hypothetical protein [Candidatus Pelagibacter sp.]MBA4282736.1 hypothetical protein [Candidatus Puniceispirillum sp.]